MWRPLVASGQQRNRNDRVKSPSARKVQLVREVSHALDDSEWSTSLGTEVSRRVTRQVVAMIELEEHAVSAPKFDACPQLNETGLPQSILVSLTNTMDGLAPRDDDERRESRGSRDETHMSRDELFGGDHGNAQPDKSRQIVLPRSAYPVPHVKQPRLSHLNSNPLSRT